MMNSGKRCQPEAYKMAMGTMSKSSSKDLQMPAPGTRWQLYLIEGFLLGCFMIAATGATIVMESPRSPVAQCVTAPILRRAVIGLAMGLTAVILIYCPWGKRSGAHMNPAFTMSFLWLGKIKLRDALGYMAGQFAGAASGMLVSALAFGPVVASPAVKYIVTVPGPDGIAAAWAGEFVIAFILVATVLLLNRFPALVTRTGLFCGGLIALFVIFEAPLSGFSMNPARTFGSSVVANNWTAWWIYFTAPFAGMLSAVELHRMLADDHSKLCLRLNHGHHTPTLHPCDCVTSQVIDSPASPDLTGKVSV
jgi:aquaporin Z